MHDFRPPSSSHPVFRPWSHVAIRCCFVQERCVIMRNYTRSGNRMYQLPRSRILDPKLWRAHSQLYDLVFTSTYYMESRVEICNEYRLASPDENSFNTLRAKKVSDYRNWMSLFSYFVCMFTNILCSSFVFSAEKTVGNKEFPKRTNAFSRRRIFPSFLDRSS